MLNKWNIHSLCIFSLFAILLSFMTAFPVQAIEITPFAGHRFGGVFEDQLTDTEFDLSESGSYGVVVDFDLSPGQQVEFIYSHQQADIKTDPTFLVSPEWDVDVDYFHIGGISSFNLGEQFNPFVAAGLGLTRVEPERFDPESRFSMSLAGGGKLFLSENIGLRLEARSYWTFFDSSSAVFCSNGSCRIFVKSDAWWQFETNLGVFFRF